MRKVNAILGISMMLLLLVHMIAGGLQLAGIIAGGNAILSAATKILTVLTVLHLFIGIKLTADTCLAAKKSGVSYWKENRLFWLRRISGFALMILLVSHLMLFTAKNSGGTVRLHVFAGAQLLTQLLMVAALLIHVLTNIRPLMLALGAKRYKHVLTDVLLVLSVLLLLAGIAFVIYYLRWNVF